MTAAWVEATLESLPRRARIVKIKMRLTKEWGLKMAAVPRKTTLMITEYSVDSMLNGSQPVMGVCDATGNISNGTYGVVSTAETALRVPQNTAPAIQNSTFFVNSGTTTPVKNYSLSWTFDIGPKSQFVFSIVATDLGSQQSTTLWESQPQSEGVISANFSLRLNGDLSLTLTPAS